MRQRQAVAPAEVGESLATAADAPRPARLAAPLGLHRCEVELDPGPAGWLVVREGFGAGWRAEVDGTPAPVFPADLAFRAVPVPANARRVVLSYETPGATAGAAVSSLTLLALAVLAGRAWRRGRARGG